MITMPQYPAGQHTVGATTFQLYVDGRGRWRADAEGFTETHAADRISLENHLKTKVSQAKVRVSIPFVQATNMGKPIRGTATGIDARTGGVTVKWADGGKSTTSRHEVPMPGKYLQNLGDGEMDELARLIKARDQAQRDLRDFTEQYEIDLYQTVVDAVEQARQEKAATS